MVFLPSVSWWHRLAAFLVLVLGIVLVPLRAEAATIPMLIAYDGEVRPTATMRIEAELSLRPELVPEYAYDSALVMYEEPSTLHVIAGAGAVHAYDAAPELLERDEVGEGVIYDCSAPTTAADAVLYTAADIGPLEPAIANTFRGGSYTARVLSADTTLYRAYGGSAGPLGRFWTAVAPAGPLQVQLDSALVPSWGNTATGVASIRVPAGTTVFEGFAAPQATGSGELLGGGSQVFIPQVDPSWLLP